MENGRRIFNDLTTHITFVQTVCQRVTSLLAKTRYEEFAQARKFAIECVNAYNRKKKEQG